METNYEVMEQSEKEQGSVARGLLGALIAALLGAVCWAVIGVLTNKVFAVVGLLVGFMVCFGYDLFKGRDGVARMVIVAVCVVLAVVAGDIGYYGWSIHSWYQEEADLLANGTDDEIAEYYYAPESYEQYKAASKFDKLYAINTLKAEVTVTEEQYVQNLLSNSEFTASVMKDCGQSIFFGLLGSFGLILSGKKKKAEEAQPVNFDEARVNADAPADAAQAAEAADDSETPAAE